MKYATTACLALLALALAGCGKSFESTPNAEGVDGVFRRATEKDVGAREYRVAPPDKLTLLSPGIKEIDKTTAQIRPDGKISLNLLGELYVTNKTPDEISKLVTELAAKYYNNPEIRIEVAEFNSKFYSVVGIPVRDPGRKPFTGRDTVCDALAQAGFTQDAWPEQVLVSRPGKNGQKEATAVINFEHMAMTGSMAQNYLLEEGDIVHIRNNRMAQYRIESANFLSPLTGGAGAVGAVQSVGPTKAGGVK